MKTRYKLLILLVGLVFQSGYTQNSTDAYRFSSYDILGSARFVALGGAFGSVGGDLSTLNYNPAGLGIFQSTEFTFSPTLNYSANEAMYNGSLGLDSKTNLNIGMLGMVSSYRLQDNSKTKSSGWKSINYGMSYARTKNFNNSIFVGGNAYNSSLANVWRDQADGYYPEDLQSFSDGLAWDTYILDTVPGSPSQYYSAAPVGGVLQNYWETSKGYINELSLAMSANYNDKLIIGLSVGFPNLHFQRSIEHNEYALNVPADYEFDNFSYKEDLLTEGTGINAKFGFIYIASPNFRFSGAFHTPTYYAELTDTYSSSIESMMGDGNSYYSESPIGNMVYHLSTPARAMLGASYFFNNKGFISVDYEYMDYGKSKLSSNTYSFLDENHTIRTDFQATQSLRIGAEWRMDNLTLRGGYNVTGSPMNPDVNDIISSAYSWGIGYRMGNAYLDFAYSKRKTDGLYYIYNPDYVNPANVSNYASNYVFTLGYKL